MRNLKTYENYNHPPDSANVSKEMQRLFDEIQSDEAFQKYLPEIKSTWFRHPRWGEVEWEDMIKNIRRSLWNDSGWYKINEWLIEKADENGEWEFAEKLRKLKSLMMAIGIRFRW